LIDGVEFEKDYAQKPKKMVRNVGMENSTFSSPKLAQFRTYMGVHPRSKSNGCQGLIII